MGPVRAVYGPLSGRGRFDAVFRQGIRSRRGAVTVIVKRRGRGAARVGLVVGRRVGGAVVRNRVKRRLRAALAEVGLLPGRDYVVIGTAAVASAPFPTLCGWLRAAVSETTGREARDEG